jgi:alpha-galactosidase
LGVRFFIDKDAHMLQTPTTNELSTAQDWFTTHLSPEAKVLPFSFLLDGQPGITQLEYWHSLHEESSLPGGVTQHTLHWHDQTTGLEVRCVAVTYAEHPVVEWTVYFRNTGDADTPLLENIQGLDTSIEREGRGEFVLRHHRGDYYAPDGYQPYEQPLWYNTTLTLAPLGGRGSNSAFPYYNLQIPGGQNRPGHGLILAVGWPGQWSATFARDDGRTLYIRAGQERTHLVLEPGEEIRTPLIALLFFDGDDRDRAQNLWRRWMWAYNVPRTANGEPWPLMLFGNTSGQFNEMIDASETNQKYFIDRYREERVEIDDWWMDAGWYPCAGRWPNTGTWEPDLARFPGGLRAIADHAHAKNVQILVWFEPERVAQGTWLAENHPEWLLSAPDAPGLPDWVRRNRLLNLGDPAARGWLTDHVDCLLDEQGIDLYRQDFNFDPLIYWRAHDEALSPEKHDREGITENLHIQGYLAYWDELRRRHPGMMIDSCASGGRRNDLETMRRAVPLHPTDYNYDHLAVKQAFHYTLFQWIPYFGSNTVPTATVDTYAIRSGHGMALVLGYDMRRDDLDYGLLRKLTAEWRTVAACYYGDFYPLTPYSWDESGWLAWQFHCAGAGEDASYGVIEAFRRAENGDEARTFRLYGLDPSATYEVTTLDSPGVLTVVPGQQLLDEGLQVRIAQRPGAGVIVYRIAQP